MIPLDIEEESRHDDQGLRGQDISSSCLRRATAPLTAVLSWNEKRRWRLRHHRRDPNL
jgi:hypothetical protein